MDSQVYVNCALIYHKLFYNFYGDFSLGEYVAIFTEFVNNDTGISEVNIVKFAPYFESKNVAITVYSFEFAPSYFCPIQI